MLNFNMEKASHFGLWIIIILIGGYLVYSATHSNTENTKNLPGSIDNHKEIHYYPLSLGMMGCEYLKGVDGSPSMKNDKNNPFTINSKH